MPTEIRIYFEGHALLKPGFDGFFKELHERARKQRRGFHLIPSKSGAQARRDFGIALTVNPKAWNVLLLDSEGPYDGRRARTHRNSVFWMVEMMESWFHADKEALAEFYGDGFKSAALKANPKVELISKKDLKAGLKAATRNTKKGDYFDNKTSHASKLLAIVKPDLVRQAAPNCDRLFKALLAHLE